MFFKNHFNAISEILDIYYNSSNRKGINSADIGELCELFVKNFLIDSLDDHYRIYRGGNIVNSSGSKSPQLDIILTNRNTLKLFGDKGIYPIESVISVFSITSNLTLPKLKKTIQEIGKIPKFNYAFGIEKFYGEEFKNKTHEVWKNILPFTCIFGFKGDIKETWINTIKSEISQIEDHSLWPSMIVINKKGMFEKQIKKTSDNEMQIKYVYTAIDKTDQHGFSFSKILFNLYTMSNEQIYVQPKYENYFAQDY